jgi:CRISPR/Cas system CMR-associated protein Cmr5 small subunit
MILVPQKDNVSGLIHIVNYEKYNSNVWKERVEEKNIYYPLMTHIFTCYQKEIDMFKDKVSISYAYPGFDKDISNYIKDEEYECDISIVCTNLYRNTNEFPDEATNITRYEIVDKLYENRDNIKFHIYGFENLKTQYPDCYKGFIKYQNCNKVFSNSKINLSIHPIVNELNEKNDEFEYFSERVPQILGSKGLLMTNSYLKNNLEKDKDYIYIDKNIDWFGKIMEIKNNTEEYDGMRDNGYNKGMKHYQWSEFAKRINEITLG